MTQPAPTPSLEADLAAARATLTRWHEQGHALLDPMGWAHIEALMRRLPDQPAAVQAVLQSRLNRAMHQHADRVAQARIHRHDRMQAAADHPGLHRLSLHAEQMPRPCLPLQTLNQHIQGALRQAAQGVTSEAAVAAGVPTEIRSLQRFRETWARISTEDDIDKAIGRAPDNAGPLNSHMLVLRSLDLMRSLSPAYLQRFMSQLDALLWLDQINHKPAAASARPGRHGKAKG